MNIDGALNQLLKKIMQTAITDSIVDMGDNSLLSAVFQSRPNEVQKLIENGADVNYISHNGYTALAYAYGGLKALLRDRRDKDFKNEKKCIQLLLQHGADPQLEPPGKRIIFGGSFGYRRFLRVKFAVAHVAMLRALNVPISTQTLWEIHSCDKLSNYFKMCTHLLQVKIYESLTILQLLTDSDQKILVYARNPILLSKLTSLIYNKYDSNSYYFNRIQQRFQKAIVANKCADFIASLFGGDYDSQYPIVNKIVNYLDEVDMKVFQYVSSTTK